MSDLSRSYGSSGNLLADRRFGYAEALLNEGDFIAAADLLEQVIVLTPNWAPALVALGLALEKTGQHDGAFRAMSRAADLDQLGRLGAVLHLARFLGDERPAMPQAYVTALFDQYAPRFDAHLLGALGYCAPAVLTDALDRTFGLGRLGRVLDLGCGTGLMARALAGRAEAIDGVDLSPRMVDQARGTDLYRQVFVADCVDALTQTAEGAYDLTLAADVFVYLGDLDPVLRQVARVLPSGGATAFTVQMADNGRDFWLGPDLRFSHSPAYVHRTVAAAGLAIALFEARSTRRERGTEVPGLAVVARAP